MIRGRRSTPAGQHRAVLLDEVLTVLAPQPGEIVVDCTVGWAGHAVALLHKVGPNGHLVGLDLDADNLEPARERLQTTGYPFTLHHGNFAGLQSLLAAEQHLPVDLVLADLGMSSMQVDDSQRGFSYVRDGPLDMRMDRSRGRSAAQILATISREELCTALRELGDEPQADSIAAAIVACREQAPLQRTAELTNLILRVVQPATQVKSWRLHPAPNRWELHPAARTFQALRILVNRELANLEQLLRHLACHTVSRRASGDHQFSQRRGPARQSGFPRRAASRNLCGDFTGAYPGLLGGAGLQSTGTIGQVTVGTQKG